MLPNYKGQQLNIESLSYSSGTYAILWKVSTNI